MEHKTYTPRRAGLSIPAAAAALGCGTRTLWRYAQTAPELFPRDGGQQIRIAHDTLPQLRALLQEGKASRLAGLARGRAVEMARRAKVRAAKTATK